MTSSKFEMDNDQYHSMKRSPLPQARPRRLNSKHTKGLLLVSVYDILYSGDRNELARNQPVREFCS